MGVNIDHNLATGANGIYTFHAHGSIYHSIGSLLPNENCRPRYMQMWIIDTEHEIENRIQENNELRRDLLTKLQNILDRHNPFVSVFRQIGRRQDIPTCRLIIKQQKPNEHQYSLPTVSQVAAVIVDNEVMINLSGRDIVVQGINGDLINIQDIVGYYDPLQYPLFLPHGTYGWNINTRNIDGTRLSCLNYYAYMLQKDVVDKGVLGNVRSYSYVIEYQKRGLPHAHMLLIFENTDKLRTPDEFDSIVRAEIPSQTEEPNLYEAVLHHMIHGPCGLLNRHSPCMTDDKCKKHFPKPFVSYTSRGNDSYPLYRRRQGLTVVLSENDQRMVDNGWVVPYNPWLLLKYDCHINVEVCGGIKCVKYIYKYIHKGPDRVALELRNGQNIDEIQQYVDGRWICAPEALWRIFSFEFSRMYPSVIRLQIHLPYQHLIIYDPTNCITDILTDDRNTKTILTEFFKMNNDQTIKGK
ncbi:uncharacterized protein [Henckelia pumila]|uniref:uncharacterized protein n=1 Tax=Henckelia pumila TaxID=405737 RepID=UPI003C6E8202